MVDRPQGKERRRLKRIVRRIPVNFMAGGHAVEGYIKNLSKEGVVIRANSLPQPGETLPLVIRPTAVQKIDVQVTIRWTTDQYLEHSPTAGFGARLELPVPDDYLELFEYVLLT